MGRPREHDEDTAEALVAAAEQIVAKKGADALSIRAVADEAGTTTRAIYSLFGSKDGLVAALARSAFDDVSRRLDALPESDDPVADVMEAGVSAFRPFVIEHPWLYRIAFQRVIPDLQDEPRLSASRNAAFARLVARFERCVEAGLLRGRNPTEAAIEFNALCEGLANAELRGQILPILPEGRQEQTWRDALATLLRGLVA